ncbi:flagellar basal body P-ring protein FlgI [Helicobacter saguini]|uniref:Flagellar P-ring protein n=1 Tax=Helicobacter saguini TaxID=1548018 RepID=A0A347VQ54_9HELI|nr:flagellar basal body P-ring protein FlgI [Helicobacter saguini]MWV61071.1 flagellar basal body P-ring protein FlgI [Helicobacter saguini]MWV68260.1 flagellar basal body P-ring protein FlgI [Helicobacter saguini]MWV70276.1 flagellar basal body P-ring protein FlgI [Helicobacter saguini]MWV72178.1 flagellar basal body P-ring protein FlgI [Helicobacter saguini]TLD95237.1 flagellar basal body P-ring protein FlgI [Helicobacter saguini]
MRFLGNVIFSKVATLFAVGIFLVATFFLGNTLRAEKIGDLTSIAGVRDNQLMGYGIVIGLNGTGDKGGSQFTAQSMANMLETMNVKLSANDIKSKNVAAVMVTASLPPFARQGDKIDIKISSIGDAKSLQGGTLVMTPLNAVDGQIYAVAQGAISVGKGDSLVSGTINGGATIEKEVVYNIGKQDSTILSLKKSDFQNAIKVQNKLREVFGENAAVALDSRTVRINKPDNLSMIEYLALVQEVDIPYSAREKIVIDEKSGTIVSGLGISVQPIVLTHGDLTLKITNEFDSNGSVSVDSMSLDPKTNTLSSNGKIPTVASVVRALQRLGASPQSVISILETMKRSGAIAADIEVL